MRIKAKRRSERVGPFWINRSGLRLTSITLDLGPLWSAVLWERRR